MKTALLSHLRHLICSAAALCLAALPVPAAHAQSQSGFTYNGVVLLSYQANEYTGTSAAAAKAIKATGANFSSVLVTQYQATASANVIAANSTTPTDAALVAAIQNLQAQGITVVMKPQVDSLDGTFRGNFMPTSPNDWFTSYSTFLLHYAQLASQNNVGVLVIGTELAQLTGPTYKANWETLITQLRTLYPSLTLTYAANATGAGDEFTKVSFWQDIDLIGVDGYFPLTGQADPTVAQLVAAWSNNKSGFNPLGALKNLQSMYNKPLIFTEIGYVSAQGTNEAPYANATGPYDPTEQANCFQAFFEVYSQQTAWMKGVFWWGWSTTPPGANDTGYSPQNKPAGNTVFPKWFGSTTSSFTLAGSNPNLALIAGGSSTQTISVTPLGGFSGQVTFAASGLPAGVTASFSQNPATISSVMTLTAANTAALTGPLQVMVTGTSGSSTASTTFALTVLASPGFKLSAPAVSFPAGAISGNTATISITPAGAFTGSIALSCAITPVAASNPAMCSVGPASVPISGPASQVALLTISSTAATTASSRMTPLLWPATGLTAMAGVLFLALPRRRNIGLRLCGLLLLMLPLSLAAAGCNGSAPAPATIPGTTPGTYMVTVTGTAGAFSASTVVPVTIQ